MKIKILVDSGSDISQKDCHDYNITVVPLTLIINGKPQTDYYDFNSKDYCDLLLTNENVPTTSQPSPSTFIKYFEEFEEEYDHIICITMSSKGSGTFNSAGLAKELYEDENPKCQIHLIDSYMTTYGIVSLAKKAFELANNEIEINDIIKYIEEYKKHFSVYFLVDNTDFLVKGGRVSAIKGSLISKFQIKPIISIKDGEGVIKGKAMGYKNGLIKIAKLFEKEGKKNSTLFVTHANCIDNAKNLINIVKGFYPKLKYQIEEMKGTMSTHVGPGGIGIVFKNNI